MTDKSHPFVRVAALRYKPGEDAAPVLVAKGQDAVAQRILAIARDHSIPTYEDPALVQVLSRLRLDDEIPVELWLVVAQILGMLHRAEIAARSRAQRPISATPSGR